MAIGGWYSSKMTVGSSDDSEFISTKSRLGHNASCVTEPVQTLVIWPHLLHDKMVLEKTSDFVLHSPIINCSIVEAVISNSLIKKDHKELMLSTLPGILTSHVHFISS